MTTTSGASGDTTLVGTDENDKLIGGSGNDTLSGGDGSDFLNGGSGNDTLDGGSGFDTVLGGSGSDTLIFRSWENQWMSGSDAYDSGVLIGSAFTGYDSYDGGSGAVKGGKVVGTADIDTLFIHLSQAQMDDAGFMSAFTAEYAQFLAFIAANTNQNTGQAGPAEFTFTTINLKVSSIEKAYYGLDPTSPVAVADSNAGDAVKEAGVQNGGNTPEPGDTTAAGNVLDNDTDVDTNNNDDQSLLIVSAVGGDALKVGAPVTGTYGSVVINGDGSYTYTLDNADPDTNALAQGDSVTDVFSYTVKDPDNLTATATLTITIAGTNDAPVATGDSNAGDAVKEAGVQNGGNTPEPGDTTAVGNVLDNDTDADTGHVLSVAAVAGDALKVGNPVTGTYGSVVINGDGSYTYTLDNADPDTNALAQGDSVTDVFSYTVTDEHGATATATLTITIAGTNDAPVATGDSNAGDAVKEAGFGDPGDATAAGNVLDNDTDVDTGHVLSVAAVAGDALKVGNPVTGTYGSVVINGDGSYTYTLDNADPDTNALAQGDSVTDVFSYTVTDEHGATATATLTITIAGTNDAPVATGDSNAGDAVKEAGFGDPGDATAAGNVLDNDTDADTGHVLSVAAVAGDALKVGNPVTGTYGSVVINGDGSYTYTLDNADPDTNALAQGDSVTDVFSYTVTDEHGATATATLTITIAGTNDAPVDNQGPTGVKFAPDLANLGTLETGNSLNANASMGTFLALGDPNSTIFTYALGGTNAGLFSLNSNTGALSVGASSITSSGTSTYQITVTATDQANNSSAAVPFNVWVGSTLGDSFNFALAGSNDFIGYGLNGGDTITGSSGDDFISGGANNDVLNGGDGNDILAGGGGIDTLNGGAGNNILSGGAGADVFFFQNFTGTSNHVTDFDAGNSGGSVDLLRFAVGAGGSPAFSVGDNDTSVENFKKGSDATINAAGTEVAVKADGSVTNATVQSTINAYTNITTGALFVFHNTDLGHAAVYYDANPNVAGGAVLVAELDNITTLVGLNNFNDFRFPVRLMRR